MLMPTKIQLDLFQMGQVALEGLLVAPGPGAPPEDLQQYLQLLAEAYRRTHALAAQLQPIAGPECNTAVQHSCHPSCPAENILCAV